MDRLPARLDERTSYSVRVDIPPHGLWVTVLVAMRRPAPLEEVPELAPRLTIPTGVPI